jgi:hypothetical protein
VEVPGGLSTSCEVQIVFISSCFTNRLARRIIVGGDAGMFREAGTGATLNTYNSHKHGDTFGSIHCDVSVVVPDAIHDGYLRDAGGSGRYGGPG